MSVLDNDIVQGPDTRPASITDGRLLRIQSWSGVLFAGFLLVHLCNQMLASFGPDVYDHAQRVLRKGYQFAPLELGLVIGPLIVHAGAGIARMVRRRRRPPAARAAPNWRTRLHRWSAVVLLVFFIGHVTATRGASLLYGVYPGWAGVAYTLRWVPAYFWPYYITFAIAGFYHLVNGLGVALRVLGLRGGRVFQSPRVVAIASITAAVLLVAGMLGFGGVLVRPPSDPRASTYAQLLRRLGVAHE